MLETITLSLVPVSLVVTLGYFAGLKVFTIANRELLTKLILKWLLPPLLLSGILATPRPDLLNYKMPLMFLIGLMVPYLVALLVCRYVLRYDANTATLKANLVAFPDMVFFGIPILGQLFGPASLYPILVGNLVPTLIIIPLTTLLLEMGSRTKEAAGTHVLFNTFSRALREPRVWLPISGAVVVLLNIHIPKVVIDSLALIGQPTTALSLFVVGLIVSEEKVRITAATVADSVIKNLVTPLGMVATVLVLGVRGVPAREAILLAALPSAVITSMFAEQYNTLTSESSTVVLATRILGFATIPLVFILTRHL
jgi:predicted permease